ncbi:hypothetical protein FKG94_26255 [Exilibacterium tricleocarpae]|uniref:DUF6249 domain-containing protein n=1 Tax=Exilibacterium tricleocarpae TaxID=2591008 RepID=A0A545SPR9_9GAMM|nr:DUF6249 domain-containing protein [Exilibacterium tricleocarpae]TQV66973.1 hypothetical protein FKG94_26255 [Exilibacterium tricleocarpae]
MNEDILIPIAAFASFAAIVITYFAYNSKHKIEVQNTIRKVLDKGDNLTPELLQKLGTYNSPRVMDLRKGLALCAIGAAALLAGGVVDELRTGIAFGVFPLLLGIAFLTVWRLNRYDD